MKVAAAVVLAIAVAVALQTTLAWFVMGSGGAIDLVLVAVVYSALMGGPVAGLLAGTVGGIAQDVLSGGIVGVAGLAKTVVGFLAGVMAAQFIMAQPLPRFVLLFGATVVHSACFLGLYSLLEAREFASPYATVASQALGNALVGVLLFQLLDTLPVVIQRRRAGRQQVIRRL